MKDYDVISIGSGSAMNVIDAMIQGNPDLRAAVIDKDEPGGICLTRGCIPSKILLYPAEVVRTIQRAQEFGIDVEIKQIRFDSVMQRMRKLIYEDINQIRNGLTHSKNIDYYPAAAEFVAPYTLQVDGETIKSSMILLCTGSKTIIPPIRGLDKVGHLTSDTILKIDRLPGSIAVVGGGYIAAEYGHFLSAMGSRVTIIGRNRQFLPEEEPEISAVAQKSLGRHMKILTNYEVIGAETMSRGEKRLVVVNRATGKKTTIEAEEILIAAGRGPNTDILHPERGEIETDKNGWIVVNDYLETSQRNVWAFGDANGRHPFKHKANYESRIVYYNAVQGKRVKVDYHATPHAVFTYPEVASVGLREKEALRQYGRERVLIGLYRYEDTAKGEAMGLKDYFVKVLVEDGTLKILGAHIVGPYASSLIQEVVNLMYTADQSAQPILEGMHIHPALSEVVERAFDNLTSPEHYHHTLEHSLGLSHSG